MIIYLDVDDVVADWYTAAQEFLKIKWRREDNYRIPYDEWIKLKNASRFYRDLPLKENAHDLVNWCQAYCDTNPGTELRFLTAIPHNNDMPWAIQDKVWWCHEHFPDIPCFLGPYSEDKQQHCRPGDILIDDRHSNCEEWIAAGGMAHIYTDWPTCEKWLLETLINGHIPQ
jgi:5'(3')-deoxyribonucleotidase